MRKTIDSFAGYPVQVVELVQFYPKRKRDRTTRCWIVSTDLDLSLEEIREAAHQRWTIENDVLNRISHLSGTKRFYFRDHERFLTLLHIFFAAMAALDYIMVLLRDHPRSVRSGARRNQADVAQRVLSDSRGAVRVTPCT